MFSDVGLIYYRIILRDNKQRRELQCKTKSGSCLCLHKRKVTPIQTSAAASSCSQRLVRFMVSSRHIGQRGSNCPVLGALTKNGWCETPLQSATFSTMHNRVTVVFGTACSNTVNDYVIHTKNTVVSCAWSWCFRLGDAVLFSTCWLYYPVLIHLLVMLPCPWSITALVGCTACVAVSGAVLYLACQFCSRVVCLALLLSTGSSGHTYLPTTQAVSLTDKAAQMQTSKQEQQFRSS